MSFKFAVVVFVIACSLYLCTSDTPSGTCPDVDPLNTTVHLADLDDCAGFYSCVGGHPVHQFCAPGTYWDIDTEYCEIGASTAKCGKRPTTTPSPNEEY